MYPGQIRYCVSYDTGSLSGLESISSYSGNFASYNEARNVYNKAKKKKNLMNVTMMVCIVNENLDLQPLGVVNKIEKNLIRG